MYENGQKVLGPLHFGLTGNENLTITFLYNLNALNTSLFELSYPFKLEGLFLVPQVLVCCPYDAFIASILCTKKMGFSFGNRYKSEGAISREYGGWGRISNPQ